MVCKSPQGHIVRGSPRSKHNEGLFCALSQTEGQFYQESFIIMEYLLLLENRFNCISCLQGCSTLSKNISSFAFYNISCLIAI